ncbi:hypothetical protein ACHAP0_000365 [Verticillium nonalfalfae]
MQLALSIYPPPVNAQETGQSVFVSPDNLVTFAFAAPTDHNRDVYFSLRVHQSVTWGAVGLGSDDMPNSLILMLYHDDEGTGVTFSPRIAFGNYEPEYYSHMRWEVLDGTGIQGDYLVFNARCTDHCRTWLHGSLDVFDHDQKAIWAVGPDGSLRSDDMDAPLPMHRQFGGFGIDMGRTNKVNATSISADAKNIGTETRFHQQSHRDLKSRFHAIFMIMSVCVLLPAGILCLRAGQMVRWHGIIQSVALVFAIVGVSLGIVTSFLYQRVGLGSCRPHLEATMSLTSTSLADSTTSTRSSASSSLACFSASLYSASCITCSLSARTSPPSCKPRTGGLGALYSSSAPLMHSCKPSRFDLDCID